MKIKTSELEGLALDWAVAMCEGYTGLHQNVYWTMYPPRKEHGPVLLVDYGFSYHWGLSGPIIARELIQTAPWWKNAGYNTPTGHWYWIAHVLGPENLDNSFEMSGHTLLVAAMRCYVASKLGDEVEIPAGLATS